MGCKVETPGMCTTIMEKALEAGVIRSLNEGSTPRAFDAKNARTAYDFIDKCKAECGKTVCPYYVKIEEGEYA